MVEKEGRWYRHCEPRCEIGLNIQIFCYRESYPTWFNSTFLTTAAFLAGLRYLENVYGRMLGSADRESGHKHFVHY